jgi:chromosome segregation ATPase
MNTEMEINNLRREYNNYTVQINAIKAKKEHLLGHIAYLNNEIENRNKFPERYPFGAGAGTIQDVKNEISTVEDEIADCEQPLEDLEESQHQLLFVMADKIGLDELKKQRTAVGKEMAKHNRLQHEAYEAQKERYENCKNTFGFTPDDRAFIAHHKALNEAHMDEWNRLGDKRQQLVEMIDALDPNDEDLGLDEEEDV